jgi:hypothetical protein
MNQEYIEAVKSGSSEALLKVLQGLQSVNPEVAVLQKELGSIQSGETIIQAGVSAQIEVETVPAQDSKKTWQLWFEEITGIASERFGASGQMAGQMYIQELQSQFERAKDIGALLGEKIDPLPYLEQQQKDIKTKLIDLFSINPNEINSPFTSDDSSVQILIGEYKALSESIAQATEEKKRLAEAVLIPA